MNRRIRRSSAFGSLVLACCMGAGGNGCPASLTAGSATSHSNLAGVWAITRGDVSADFKWTVGNGGQVTSNSTGGKLVALNPADFPESLQSLVSQWNNGLVDLNAKLDAALPQSVIVTFPNYPQITITNAADTSKTGSGVINAMNEYLLVGDLSGGGQNSAQGAGAVLDAATITGKFDATNLTTTGSIARTLLVVLAQSNPLNTPASATFTAQIKVDYTGTRTGDVPAATTP